MLGFDLDLWDYITFAVMFLIGVGAVAGVVFVLGLPGRIAVARKHPDAEAVTLLGWAGGFALVPWVKAFIWAFKPTDVVDIRKLPLEAPQSTEKELASPKAIESSPGAGPKAVERQAGGESRGSDDQKIAS
jgi:hypothetical protein